MEKYCKIEEQLSDIYKAFIIMEVWTA